MKVLSLFDGMACGALAMQAAGIEVENIATENQTPSGDFSEDIPF